MKNLKRLLGVMLIATSLVAVGCTSENDSNVNDNTGNVGANEGTETVTPALEVDYSEDLEANGFIKGLTALENVTLADYKNITIPADVHMVSDETVDARIDGILANYMTTDEITDRAIVDGDTVNIDYVGSVDGVEFDGGSTGGAGTDVTIGVTSYIDDFLEQLIGHSPGESFDIEVTFPEDYHSVELKGKDAVFAITVNHIKESVSPELTDAFVSENLLGTYGVDTVDALKTSVKNELQTNAKMGFIQNLLMDESTFVELPEVVRTYQETSMINYYKMMASSYGIAFEDLITNYGFETEEDVIAAYADDIEQNAKFTLLIQAVAEDASIEVSEDDLKAYFAKFTGSEDYSQFENMYGLPYLKFSVLQESVMNHIIDNATLAE